MDTKKKCNQKQMEDYVDKMLKGNQTSQCNSIDGMMKAQKVNCSFDDRTLTLAFSMQSWQANEIGIVHQGIICTAFEMTAATLATYCAETNEATAISLDIKYINPVKISDTVLITAKMSFKDTEIFHLACEAINQEKDELVAIGTFLYINAL